MIKKYHQSIYSTSHRYKRSILGLCCLVFSIQPPPSGDQIATASSTCISAVGPGSSLLPASTTTTTNVNQQQFDNQASQRKMREEGEDKGGGGGNKAEVELKTYHQFVVNHIQHQLPQDYIYTLPEQDPRWQKHLLTVGKDQRNAESVKRNLSWHLRDCVQDHICLFCWMIESVCMCSYVPYVGDELRSPGKQKNKPFDDNGEQVDEEEKGGNVVVPGEKNLDGNKEKEKEEVGCCLTLVLHHDEFLRQSNTGHIAALALDAPLLIAGLPSHDAVLQNLNKWETFSALHYLHSSSSSSSSRCSFPPSSSSKVQKIPKLGKPEDDEGVGGFSSSSLMMMQLKTAILYPEEGSQNLVDFISTFRPSPSETTIGLSETSELEEKGLQTNLSSKKLSTMRTAGEDDEGISERGMKAQNGKRPSPQEEEGDHRDDGEIQKKEDGAPPIMLHLVLIDATWSQAHRVIKRIPASTRRVVISISEDYQSLFAPLRKQTRSSGVSTLEAIMLTIREVFNGQTAEGGTGKKFSENEVFRELRFLESEVLATHHPASDQTKGQDDDDFEGERKENGKEEKAKVFQHQQQKEQKNSSVIEDALLTSMVILVDLVRVQKCLSPIHHSRTVLDASVCQHLAQSRIVRSKRKKSNPATTTTTKLEVVPEWLAPPVLTYCYVCEKYIGFFRMHEHCHGVGHQRAWAVKRSWDPVVVSQQKIPEWQIKLLKSKGQWMIEEKSDGEEDKQEE